MPDNSIKKYLDYNGLDYFLDKLDNRFATSSQLDGKLDKVTTTTTYGQLYGKATTGTQTMLNYATAKDANTLIMRNSTGQASIATPTENNHITNKSYVDGLIPQIKRYI